RSPLPDRRQAGGWRFCRGDRPRSPVFPSDFSLSIRRWGERPRPAFRQTGRPFRLVHNGSIKVYAIPEFFPTKINILRLPQKFFTLKTAKKLKKLAKHFQLHIYTTSIPPATAIFCPVI
ncbi:MAG: hypothetical protein FWG68_02470, partial [Defluviitaleaceae bacterium]|nr:hypothetical protein [Defluviitaleaceae bacterium]